MTEVFEKADVAKILEHKHDDTCPFCRSNETEKPENPKSVDNSDWEEDPGKRIGNNAGKLENEMAEKNSDPRPVNWGIRGSDNTQLKLELTENEFSITPNPHHVIPGNESLKKVPQLRKWIFAAENHIKADIGYDVNNHKNGVWLPSNNAMRGHRLYTDQKSEQTKQKKDPSYQAKNTPWEDEKAALPYKKKYAVACMRATGRQFHDRHVDYSKFISKVLNKIAQRMDANAKELKSCIYAEDKKQGEDKYDPPYALVTRLNGVSNRFRPYLLLQEGPKSPIFTSKLAKAYWPDKK